MGKRVTIISVERERVIEIRWRGQKREAQCTRCGTRTRLLTIAETAALAGVALPTVYGWLESGRLHIARTADEVPLVCLNSLHLLPIGNLIGESSVDE